VKKKKGEGNQYTFSKVTTKDYTNM